MTYEACEFTLRSIMSSSMPRRLGRNGRVIVQYTYAAHAFSAGIKCRHCWQQAVTGNALTTRLLGKTLRVLIKLNSVQSLPAICI